MTGTPTRKIMHTITAREEFTGSLHGLILINQVRCWFRDFFPQASWLSNRKRLTSLTKMACAFCIHIFPSFCQFLLPALIRRVFAWYIKHNVQLIFRTKIFQYNQSFKRIYSEGSCSEFFFYFTLFLKSFTRSLPQKTGCGALLDSGLPQRHKSVLFVHSQQCHICYLTECSEFLLSRLFYWQRSSLDQSRASTASRGSPSSWQCNCVL